MRDFRDAKAMAHTLRAALAARGFQITNSQSLELIAETLGVADWNTLAAVIHNATSAPPKRAIPEPSAAKGEEVRFSTVFEATLRQALGHANQRKHEYATLEHFLLALTEDADASAAMGACNVNLDVLRGRLIDYLDTGLNNLVIDTGAEAKPTVAFHRVIQRSIIRAQAMRAQFLTGADAFLAIFAESLSPAARFLTEQGVTRDHVLNHLGPDSGDTIPN